MPLKIRAEAIHDVEGLRRSLQNAVELEHATLPTYLTAMYSIKDGSNKEIAGLIKSIVMEEMLHFGLACNILNAIGGAPQINTPKFIPTYPGPLPMGIGEDFLVTLKKLSLEQVHDTFMRIEEPEHPIEFESLAAEPEQYDTIGQFYEAVKHKIRKFGPGIFTGDPALQVSGVFPQLVPVHDVETACQAIDVIIRQGEGTATNPFDSPGEVAHFYKFEEIYRGKQLVPDATAPNGFSFTGPPIPFDPAGVFPMADNPDTTKLPAGSRALFLSQQFNYTYTSLLNALHQTFNGQPGRLDTAIGVMFSLRLQAQELMQTPIDANGQTAGPAWQYQPVQ